LEESEDAELKEEQETSAKYHYHYQPALASLPQADHSPPPTNTKHSNESHEEDSLVPSTQHAQQQQQLQPIPSASALAETSGSHIPPPDQVLIDAVDQAGAVYVNIGDPSCTPQLPPPEAQAQGTTTAKNEEKNGLPQDPFSMCETRGTGL